MSTPEWVKSLSPAERLLAAASLAALAVFVVAGIERPIWIDEANSVLIAGRGFSAIVEALRRENNFPAYYFLLSAWMRVFGDSEIALRLLSGIFYVAGSGVAGALGRRVSGDARCGGYSAFFYLCSALAIRNAQNIRMYTLLGLLSGVSMLIFWNLFAERERSRRGMLWFVLVHAAGLLTHVWFSFVLAGECVAVGWFRRSELRRFLTGAAMAALPPALLWGRIFLDQTRNGATDWMARLSWSTALTAMTEFYGYVPAALLYGLAGIALVLSPAAERRRLLAQERIRLLGVLLVAGLALPLLICAVRPIYWPGRYAIIALPAVAALLGTLLGKAAPRKLLAGICLLFLTFGVATHLAQREATIDTQLPAGQSDRTTAAFLLEHAAASDAVVFTSLTRAAADYYFARAHASSRFVEISFPGEVAKHLGWEDNQVSPERRIRLEAQAAAAAENLRRLAEQGHRIWLYDGYAPELNGILKEKLDAVLPPPEKYALSGPRHNRILAYGYPAASSARMAAGGRTRNPNRSAAESYRKQFSGRGR